MSQMSLGQHHLRCSHNGWNSNQTQCQGRSTRWIPQVDTTNIMAHPRETTPKWLKCLEQSTGFPCSHEPTPLSVTWKLEHRPNSQQMALWIILWCTSFPSGWQAMAPLCESDKKRWTVTLMTIFPPLPAHICMWQMPTKTSLLCKNQPMHPSHKTKIPSMTFQILKCGSPCSTHVQTTQPGTTSSSVISTTFSTSPKSVHNKQQLSSTLLMRVADNREQIWLPFLLKETFIFNKKTTNHEKTCLFKIGRSFRVAF